MSTLATTFFYEDSIIHNIESHPAWLGDISGLKAEKMLRSYNQPYLYTLRAGEFENEYYITYVYSDLTVQHRPFVITIQPEGWWYENSGVNGPYNNTPIDEVIHLMLHCEKDECKPFVDSKKS
jgi:hypothetical protein